MVVNGHGEHAVEESRTEQLPPAVMECRGELSDFMAEVIAGTINPLDVVIVFRSTDGSYGFRGNNGGSGLMQVGLLEAAKAVILSKAISGRPTHTANDA